jgi:hypothetical protein
MAVEKVQDAVAKACEVSCELDESVLKGRLIDVYDSCSMDGQI